MLDAFVDRFRRGDRLALARLITLVARGEQVEAILTAVGLPARPARVVALTGSGGVGKSSLTGQLLAVIRGHGLRVAVLACDPESPVSGGALLGDRFRMPAHPRDDGVFIRSLAAAGGQDGLARHLDGLVRLCEGFGFDVVLLETVGAGQGDTAVRRLVDVLVLLLQPETGDDLQWEKAGLFEVADVLVIHKADLPGAERVEAQVLAALALAHGPTPPVLRVSARNGTGVAALWDAVVALPLRRAAPDGEEALLGHAQRCLAERFRAAWATGNPELRDLARRWHEGGIPPGEVGERVLRALAGPAEGVPRTAPGTPPPC